MYEEQFMQRALELAEQGKGHTNPNPMVGAVIVKDGRIIGEGFHERCGSGHAEVNAFASCKENPEGAEMYVTLEPCSHYGKTPPCADLIVSKKVKSVYVSSLDPNPLVAGRGIRKLKDAGIHVETGFLDSENKKLNEIFMKYILKKEPFVLLKSAMTLDGKIATAGGESKWITNEASREHSHFLRNQYMSILVGIGTVLADNPKLTCRVPGGKDPIRVVIDSHLRIPEDAMILEDQEQAGTYIFTTAHASQEKKQRLSDRGIRVIEAEGSDGEVDLKKVFAYLGEEGIDSVLVEGGSKIAGSVVRAHLADRVITYIAPKLIGGEDAKSAVGGEGIRKLSDAMELEDTEVILLDGDIAVTGRVVK